MSGLRAAIERLRQAMDDRTDNVEVIDTSGPAPWTRQNWPPWRHPEMHPIPEGWTSQGAEPPKAERSQPLGEIHDDH